MLALKKRRCGKPTLILPITLVLITIPSTITTSNSAFAHTTVKSQPTTAQEPKATDVQDLKPGAPLERELAGGASHSYKVSLTHRQYLKVLVAQKGIELLVRLFGPDGEKLSEVDNLSTPGVESVFTIAGTAGVYRVEVQSSNKDAKAGTYEIKAEELREATSKDRAQVDAQKLFEEAKQLRGQQTAESRQNAIKKYEEALLLWRTAEDRLGEANTLSQIGSIYRDLSNNPKALDYLNQALQLYQAVESRQHEAIALDAIGVVHWQAGEMQKALEYLDRALPLSRTVGDRKTEAATLNDIGNVYIRLDNQQRALEYFEQALSIKRLLGDALEEATTLVNIGASYDALGQLQKALEYYNQALPLLRLVGSRDGEAVVLNNSGYAYFKLGELQKALEYYGQSVLILRDLGNRFGEGYVLDNMGQAYRVSGEPQKALQSYDQALEIRRAIADRAGQATTFHNMGMVYLNSGEPQRALDYFEQALLLKPEAGDRRDEATTLDMIGRAYLGLGETRKALDYSNQSLTLRRAVGDRYGEAKSLANIGAAYFELGEWEKALEYSDQSLKLLRTVGDRPQEAATLHTMGSTYSKLREAAKAMEFYERSLVLSRTIGFQSQEATTLLSIARLERDGANLVEARRHIEAALTIIESTRAKVVSQGLRSSYLASRQDHYEFYIDLLMQMHRNQPTAGFDLVALQASERARARSLLDMLNEARADIRQGVDPALLERERSLQQQLNGKTDRLTRLLNRKHTDAQESAARKEIEVLVSDYQDVAAQIRVKSPRYAALTQPQPLAGGEIQQLLDNDTLLLEYALGEERSYLWAVTPTSIKSFELPKRSEIETSARQVYDLLVTKTDKVHSESLTALSKTLLGPVADQLGRKRLVIIGQGTLQYLPFGALADPSASRGPNVTSQPLILNHEIVSLPSASVMAVMRREFSNRKVASKKVMVFADPVFGKDDQRVKVAIKSQDTDNGNGNGGEKKIGKTPPPLDAVRSANDLNITGFERLPLSRTEADLITAIVPRDQSLKALDFGASRAIATGPELSRYQIVHFATHSLLNNQHPELSGIVLSLVDEQGQPQDGFLRLHDIYNLKSDADLVVLSACQTALGKEIKGEGLIGLTRGFMYAGTPRVVASLWKVSDKATAELMKRFYQKMLRDRLRPAAALRAAQVSMLKEKQWEAPYYWAGFVLQGEWK